MCPPDYHSPTMPKTSSASKPRLGRRETFNQVMLMLILAFTFRVFVVEAFVIPTGSMAPTLKGAHARFICDNCGYHYDVNYSSPLRSGGTDINIPRTAVYESGGRLVQQSWQISCPNCGFQAGADQSVAARVFYGDRILVLKYAYLLESPRRWDVVVFKTPADPNVYHYSQAYIKRLIGLPGESIMILDGDIYAAASAKPEPGDWRIQRKSDLVQDALWRIVNDIDHAPLGLAPESRAAYERRTVEDYLPWIPSEQSWRYTRDGTGARAFAFSDTVGRGTLRFDRRVREGEKIPLTDWLAYDQLVQRDLSPVSDLKLSLSYTRQAGSGPFELKLSKRGEIFTARLLPDGVELARASFADPDAATVLARKPWKFPAGPVRVEFMNVDYRVRLLIDGQEALVTTPEQYSPDVQQLMRQVSRLPYPTVSMAAAQQVCTVTHLSLWRDTYYTQQSGGRQIVRGGPENPVALGKDEYFAMGDNSPLSEDGRFWMQPVHLPAEEVEAQAGVVPARFMLGKALLVYWPAGYRLYYDSAWDLIPNFGEMRFIH